MTTAPKTKRAAKAPKPASASKGGRPSPYKAEKHNQEAYDYALLGLTDAELCEVWGIGESTLYVWKNKYPEFREAIERARMPADAKVVASLHTSALGGLVKETKAIKVKLKDGSEDVKVVEVETYIPPNPSSIQFYLTNRQRARWKNYKQVENVGSEGGPIQHTVTSAGVEKAINRVVDMFGGKSPSA